MNNENNYGVYQTSFSGIMNKVYGIMFLGLLLTAATAFILINMLETNPSLVYTLFTGATPWILFIVEIGLVWYLSSRILEMSSGKAIIMFAIYSIINGITLSVIFLIYDIGTIYTAFLTTAVTFAVMSAYGYLTKSDLTGIGKLLFFGLIGLIIAHVVNIFIPSSQFDLYISYAGVIIFLGLTAYDTQKIKAMSEQINSENIAVLGALNLYLDFINLFLYLLRILGRRER